MTTPYSENTIMSIYGGTGSSSLMPMVTRRQEPGVMIASDSASSKIKKYNQTISIQVSKGANIRNRYNQVPHLTQNTKGKVTHSQLDTIKWVPRGQPIPSR